MPVKISTRNIYKNYGAVEALRGVSVDVHEGEIHAICGDNGAGKSTLIKILAGVEQPDSGEIVIDGAARRFESPNASLRAGLATIHQDLAVAPEMAIYQNIFMGAELTRNVLGLRLLDKRRMRNEAVGYMSQLNGSITNMNSKVNELSGGQRQAVAICRALRWNANIVILDEPTAALGVRETEQVLGLVRSLKENGKTVILISHAMKDVAAVADRVTILRTGENQISLEGGDLTADNLSHYILSGEVNQVH
ncbi:monosaccharide ABC transporter ATP-binding protein, CUT2 family [Hoeflea sp. IMCC20628]|uniref:ATP-binding cassette domain-containing protein n=1 Tax=Hoeflea sp. IMCC20628 TaxID=1620421 RepID=UPI00063AF782|nr:ATP-binding cassette domain-containing protein [Hoeflea sp. IMCC20628]AKI01861.1 monosaccharide ABC transporter ATP-binding protein, CUT2 family [Hoeflea sp. IMCC20628]